MILLIYLLTINITTFALYGIDKKRAERDKYRISEFSLITFAIIGGALGAFLGMLCFHHKTRKKKFYITIPLMSLLWIGIIIFCLYSNYHLVVTEYEYHGDKVTPELDGFKIVQISDLHNQIFGYKQQWLLDKIKAEDPDIIAVTGDAIDKTHTNYTFAKDFFEGAVKIAPTYYITGNHEGWLDEKKFESFLSDIEELGVHFIDNTVTVYNPIRNQESGEYTDENANAGILIMGIAEESLPDSADIIRSELKFVDYYVEEENVEKENAEEEKPGTGVTSIPDNRLLITLAHKPYFIDTYAELGSDIVLTGHIHGGQIIIPGKGGLLSPDVEFFPDMFEGVHTKDNTTLYLSRGLGNSVLPVRINDYPEIVVITLKAD